jgi:hypothetical protein
MAQSPNWTPPLSPESWIFCNRSVTRFSKRLAGLGVLQVLGVEPQFEGRQAGTRIGGIERRIRMPVIVKAASFDRELPAPLFCGCKPASTSIAVASAATAGSAEEGDGHRSRQAGRHQAQ